MTDSVDTGATGGGALAQRPADQSPVHPSFHGRPVSWFVVSVITVGFLTGGAGLVFGQHGPAWWLFWTGAGLTVLGLLLAVVTNVMDDWY
jgi:hypothetical protein